MGQSAQSCMSFMSPNHLQAAIRACEDAGLSVHRLFDKTTALGRAVACKNKPAVEILISAKVQADELTALLRYYKSLRTGFLTRPSDDHRLQYVKLIEDAQDGLVLKNYVQEVKELRRHDFEKEIETRNKTFHYQQAVVLKQMQKRHTDALATLKTWQQQELKALEKEQQQAHETFLATKNDAKQEFESTGKAPSQAAILAVEAPKPKPITYSPSATSSSSSTSKIKRLFSRD